MEIIGSSKEKSMVYVAVLTLAVIGFALVFSTWQILRRQEKASLEHLELTSLAVLQAVDSSLRRGPMMGRSRFSLETRDFFRDLENNGDILFVGILDEDGNRLAAEGDAPQPIDFPPEAIEALQYRSRWQGVARYGDTQIYVAARRIQGTADHPGAMHRQGERRHHREDDTPLVRGAAEGLFLVVAMDMEKHFAVYQGFKRTAIFQTAYILAAAVFLWILAVRFISRRKLAGKAALLEQFQARLIDNLPDGLLITDAAGGILAANPAAQGIVPAENPAGGSLAGRTLAAVFDRVEPPVDLAADKGWQQTSLEGMQLEIRVLTLQQNHAALDGEEAGPSRMVIVRDRTRIRTLEKNLAEAEKLAAIGSLAAGVAHEIRNPLSALRGFAQYFAKKLAGKQPEEEYAQTMVRESDRLNRVITDLLYLARPRNLAPVPMDLTAVCGEMSALLHFELQEQGLSLGCDLGAATVNADPDALKQALLNLLLNALEAVGDMPSDGSGVERAVAIAARRATERGVPGVWVTVTDSGPGMSEEEQAQACKPFFTTKKKGTGLGLALVHTIMQGHGGVMAITSPAAPDGKTGCAVSLFFPDPTTTSGT